MRMVKAVLGGNGKNKLILSFIMSLGIAIIGCILTHYFTIKEIDYEQAYAVAEQNESEEALLQKAEKYYLINNYIETIHIYNMEKLNTNAIALSNLGYMYEHGLGYGKDIEKAREYYQKANCLGNKTAMENYVLFTIKYPISFDNLLRVLRGGFEEESEVAYNFIATYLDDPNPTKDQIAQIMSYDNEKLKEILCYQIDSRLKETTENLSDELMVKQVYYETKEDIQYKTLEYMLDSGEDGIYIKKVPVTISVPVGDLRSYYLDFVFSYNNLTEFILLDSD